MTKLTKQDKIHIFKEWISEKERGTYLGKKYGVRRGYINYLVKLIKIHGFSILDKSYTYYSKEYKERAIKRVLFGNEAVTVVALDLGLSSGGILANWIRSYKENGYNVVIKKKGRSTREQEKADQARETQARKRRTASPEFKTYCRKCIDKKIGCLGSREKKPTKMEIAQAVTELRQELGLGVKTILSAINDPDNNLPHLSQSNYYDVLQRKDQDEIKHHKLIKRIKEIDAELKNRYVAPGYRVVNDHLHNEGFKVNRKTIYRLMRKLNLSGYRMRRRKRYDSYEGEIEGRIKPNLIKRNFFAVRPNMKWYTDIIEFNLRGQKLYLAPIIDGSAGDIVAYNISRHPNLKQVMTMLDDAFAAHPAIKGLIFHSDRGWQYQNRTYQHELAAHGIEQSMSKKGCPPDD